jgi:hypothetical protein
LFYIFLFLSPLIFIVTSFLLFHFISLLFYD